VEQPLLVQPPRNDPFSDHHVDHPAGTQENRPRRLSRLVIDQQEPRQVREHLRPGAEADGVRPHHPVAVHHERATANRVDGQQHAHQHRGSEEQTFGVHHPAIACGPRIPQRHPEPGDRRHQAAHHEHASRVAVPAPRSPTQTVGELKRPEHAEDDGADDVQRDGVRRGEEARVRGRDLSAPRQLGETRRAGDRRHQTQADERGGDQPIGGCLRHVLLQESGVVHQR
jgi:hypothetical protein